MGWSIRKKLVIFLLLATVVPFTLSNLITYYYTTESVKDRFVSTNYDVIENGKKDVSNYLEEITQMTPRLYGYHPFIKVLQEGILSDIGANQQEVYRTLLYLYNTRPEIEQIHLYLHKGNDSYTIYNSKVSSRGKYEEVYTHPYYSTLSKRKNFLAIEPTHEIYSYNNLSNLRKLSPTNVMSFHHLINEIPSDQFLGFLSIDVNLSQIAAISDRLYDEHSEEFYLMNESGTILYSSHENLIGQRNEKVWFQKLKEQPKEDHNLEWKDDHFSGVIVHDTFSGTFEGWRIVKRIPYDVLYGDVRKTAFINLLIGIPFLVIVIIATLMISFKLTSPIRILIQNMKKVEKGSFEVDFKSLGNDEFGVLGRHFTSMVETINDLIERKYRLEIENKSAQLKVLQSQINPHFLYNALQSIGTLALKHRVVQVYSLLTSLSHIMRYSMNMKEDIVSLDSEIQHVTAFLTLQKQRFNEKFDYSIHMDEALRRAEVPKMILQPLVENSFKHGFEQKVGGGYLEIRGYETNSGTVCIVVKDNGVGVDKERLSEINRQFTQNAEEQQENIGLKNIYDRLHIYYGNEANMFIESEQHQYFTVIVELPKRGVSRESIDSRR
ncbi:sensor histidine kinase [Metabacillus iocasae]|uniref:Two-component system sensor histidine kinase YesM n=1 Tax=Priestia iocasae TaxID=2291674 RepID=A0ABS2QT68_9BACI|nr:histidine kinase [Metabacillus iocasae]MBM7702660.1 two-component system sensor histidine kinase YesM [Metabacillus iocasae]